MVPELSDCVPNFRDSYLPHPTSEFDFIDTGILLGSSATPPYSFLELWLSSTTTGSVAWSETRSGRSYRGLSSIRLRLSRRTKPEARTSGKISPWRPPLSFASCFSALVAAVMAAEVFQEF
ncbi:unnamed protein product [Linum trigynum]|uniref:Uncharacterized protein n=1 Tax=Linum trigynum TaxID=586398 RepID=A0AAV2GBW6_9ROSI